MILRIRALLASVALVAAFGPLAAVHAQSVTAPDSATAAAIALWHDRALAHVAPALHDSLAAMYADQPISDLAAANATAGAKALAEQAAMVELDPTSQQLIKNYYSQVETATFAGIPTFSESNDS